MNIISWNCRGSGGTTVFTLNRYLRCTKAQIAFVSETRCGSRKAEDRIQKLPLCNYVVVPSEGRSGGLWMLWGDEVSINLIQKTKNMIVVRVREKGPRQDWILIGVYGDPSRVGNPALWEELEAFVIDNDEPVCLVGDFNAIVAMSEKWGGREQLSSSNRVFRTWIHEAGLIDLGHNGPAYTWSNKKAGSANISERLDRAIATLDWTMKFPNTAVFHLPRFQSDHLPILIRTEPPKKRRKHCFKCENWWSLREDFNQVCTNAVQKGGLNWLQVTKCFRAETKKWLRKTKNPDVMLRECEQEMLLLNSLPPDQAQSGKEKEIEEQHKRCLLMNEYYWHQRSRLNWSMFGDNNTKFFHASAVTRKRRNTIKTLLNAQGTWETDEKIIRHIFVTHFRSIYTKGNRANVEDIFGLDLLQSLPKISDTVHDCLVSDPTDQEIFKSLMSLGPNKAAGPDGFNAKIVQDNWGSFGPTVLSEAKEFFRSGVMPAHIARSSLILIPKSEEAVQVGHFRPISVCNIIYKVISKVICLRLKPFIASCISAAQSAFVPGREISDNIILLREVLHSFKQKNYKNKEFCLKVDLSKAFDRMDWDYLERIMPFYGIPTRMIMWIMGCVRSAEFSVILNGVGDGFFKPQCGLRQGCSLSPYLFILGMDLLSRALQNLVSTNVLKGLRIAPNAEPLTSCVYADDLLLFGTANVYEAQIIAGTLHQFSLVSGQQVGPDKSSIWFSSVTPEALKVQVSQVFGVSENTSEVRYLGAPVTSARVSYDFFIDKFSTRLQSWKGRLLSHAGRIILVKSVLQSLPIYYMATDKIPNPVIKVLTGMIRRFFWGALNKNRFLSYVSWAKITNPIEKGGLGFRDLNTVNDAMLMKLLWKVASGSGPLWVNIVISKYIPRSELWHSRRTYRCTTLWRGVMRVRAKLLPLLTWRVGNGATCKVYGQPWFPGATDFAIPSSGQRCWTLKDLRENETGNWDSESLIHRFGYQNCLQIIANVAPPRDDAGDDKLIFIKNTNGQFSIKKAYHYLKELEVSTSDNGGANVSGNTNVWKLIWHKGSILPRIRVFLWKVLHGALPLAEILAKRMSKGDPTCAICGHGQEDVVHMLFTCHFARSCWFRGPLALKTDNLSDVATFIRDIAELEDEHWLLVANSAWSIWRCRNDMLYGGQLPTFERFSKYLQVVQLESLVAASVAKRSPSRNDRSLVMEAQSMYQCYVDGSWRYAWKGGLGFVLKLGEELVAYRAAGARVCCSLQAEAVALREAVEYVMGRGITSCIFFTDNQTLAIECTNLQPPLNADWRAFKDMYEIWKLLKENKFECCHINRSQNGMADHLAKAGSALDVDYIGFTYPTFFI